MNEFWTAFWPNFASTLSGLVLGIPLGLWVNHRMIAHSEKIRKTEENKRLHHALDTVNSALSFNQGKLRDLITTLKCDRAFLDPGIDQSAWEACREEIIPFLRDPVLQRQIAYHFAQLRSLTRLSNMYLDFVAGVGSALGRAPELRASLRDYIMNISDDPAAESTKIKGEIMNVQARCRFNGST